MSPTKIGATEMVLCVFDLLLGGFAAWSFWHAYSSYMHGGGSGYGPGLEIGMSIIAGVIISGIGSLLAFLAKKQKEIALKRLWTVASGLNYSIFVVGGLYLGIEVMKSMR